MKELRLNFSHQQQKVTDIDQNLKWHVSTLPAAGLTCVYVETSCSLLRYDALGIVL